MARALRSLVVLPWLLHASLAWTSEQVAVEYHHAGWNYYFVTAFADEIAVLDGGAFGGAWKRTGQSFPAWTSATEGTSAVCRFFSTGFAPRSSHFYTPLPAECDAVKGNRDWQYEAIAFHLRTTDGTGQCPPSTAPLYRLYNNGAGGAPNHRYTSSRTTFDQMRAEGWVPEGNGPSMIFACTPPHAMAGHGAAGTWIGTTSANESVRAIVLEDGTFYLLYSVAGGAADAGVVQGKATMASGTFISTDGFDYPIAQAAETPGFATAVAISGTFTERVRLDVTLAGARGTRTLSAAWDPRSAQAAALAPVAGSYVGFSGHDDGRLPATFLIDGSGTLAGSNSVCGFGGTLTPRSAGNVYDWTVRSTRGVCIFGDGPVSGIAFHDEATRQFRGFATFEQRRDLYYVLGTRR